MSSFVAQGQKELLEFYKSMDSLHVSLRIDGSRNINYVYKDKNSFCTL